MLRIKTSTVEYYDEKLEMFINPESFVIELEHSLNAISQWESKWEKVFLTDKPHTVDEMIDYYKTMAINDPPEEVWALLTNVEIEKIQEYMSSKKTATITQKDSKKVYNSEPITSELIYYWMIALQIPFECQYWHLNRLLTLISVCSQKNNPNKKKRSTREIMQQNHDLNAARRKALNTKG